MLFELPRLNLQLFSEDEELEDEDVFLDDDLEDTEEEDEEIEEDVEIDQEEEIEEEEHKILDKKTKSIIKHKKENKELRKRLQELEEQVQKDALEKETSQRVIELTKEGKSSQEATKIANEEKEVKQLRTQLAKYEIEKLESKYPGISIYASKLAEDKAKLPDFSYESIYLAKYAKSTAYDEKTKLEQELLYKSKEARSKALEKANTKNTKSVKLSAEDERIYQYLKQSNPNMTRKQFKALAEADTLE